MLARSLAWCLISGLTAGAFVCRSDWDDYCPPNGSLADGCSPQGYKLLPEKPDWIEIRKKLIKEMFGQDQLPTDDKPQGLTTFTKQHRFPDCLSSIWGSAKPSACEKSVPIMELLWEMPAALNATFNKTITSKVFLTMNASGWAPGNAIWGPDQPQAPVAPHRGKTLVIFHHGHGESKGCPTYGDTDGTTNWLNEMGLDVATMMMPFVDCNIIKDQPPSRHAWFQNFEDKGVPWVRFFLEPVIKTINFAKNQLGYEHIVMAGLSGGGWTTTVAAAVDPRIELSMPIAGSIPCDFRHTSWDFEQYCGDRWANIGNYTALYVLAALEKDRTSVQLLHQEDPCCFHGCGRHRRIQDYNRFVRQESSGLFRTVVTEGNLHEVNPREKIIAGYLSYKLARDQAISAMDLVSPFDLLREGSNFYV
eukprot:Skav202016  [mRNA]  locus=scaffold1138:58510:59766:+ [translate_table: standard]